MKESTYQSYRRFFRPRRLVLSLLWQGILVGLATGLIACLYRAALQIAEEFAQHVLALEGKSMAASMLVIVAWAIMALAVGQLIRFVPLIRGSGIPQVEGELLGQFSMNWPRVLFGKFAGGMLAIAMGFSLGREGPSIQLGAATGKGVARLLGRHPIEEKYLIAAGASAGLSAAFNAPLAGVMFALEEVYKNFAPLVLAAAMVASLAADFLSKNLLGMQPALWFGKLPPLPLSHYAHYFVLGLLLGLGGVAFCKALLWGLGFFAQRIPLPRPLRILVPAFFLLLFGAYMPLALGGGHHLIETLSEHHFAFFVLLALFSAKFGLTVLCFASGAPGGIFLPMLALGATLGTAYATAASALHLLPQGYALNFLVAGMAGYFAAVVRAPITGIILILEMTGSLTHLLGVSTVVFTAHLTAELLGSKPVYESLLNRALQEKHRMEHEHHGGKQVVLDFCVCANSSMDCKKIRDLTFPKACLLVSVVRGGQEILPDGETLLRAGDRLVVLTEEMQALHVRDALLEMGGKNCSQD